MLECVTTVIDEVVAGSYRWPRRVRNRRLVRRVCVGAGVAILVAALVTGTVSLYEGGTFLRASGGGYGHFGVVDQQYSFGVQLETKSGPSVRLAAVSASYSTGLQVSWSIYRNRPGEMGFGSWQGPLRPRWPTVVVHGYRVAQAARHAERGGTWLVGSVRATRPGVYHVSRITIRYRSGVRTRRVTAAGTDMCLLAVRPADLARIARQVDAFEPHITTSEVIDPLVARYEECSNPSLIP
jgi:hypothetical protein